eukprot:3287362-Amphidinium_carterae.3
MTSWSLCSGNWELIVQMKLRRTSVRVDTALGISTQQQPQSSARNAEAKANGAMAPPKSRTKERHQSGRCALPTPVRMDVHKNKCLRCGPEAHLVKARIRPSKRKDARAFQPEDASEGNLEPEQQYDDEEADKDYDEDVDEQEQEKGDAELNPDESNAMGKGKAKARIQDKDLQVKEETTRRKEEPVVVEPARDVRAHKHSLPLRTPYPHRL